MLDQIFDVLGNIAEFISLIFETIVSFVQDIVTLIQTVYNTLAELPQYFNWLPAELVGLLLVIFGVVVLYKVLGREG